MLLSYFFVLYSIFIYFKNGFYFENSIKTTLIMLLNPNIMWVSIDFIGKVGLYKKPTDIFIWWERAINMEQTS